MKKHPFLAFILILGSLFGGCLWFIQGSTFAQVIKNLAFQYIPKNTGVTADFTELSIQFFPPGFSIHNPKVSFEKKNILHLPPGKFLSAEKLDVNFNLIQLFFGNFRIHELTIENGNLEFTLASPLHKKEAQKEKKFLNLQWEDLFQSKIEAIHIKNLNLFLKWANTNKTLEARVNQLQLAQQKGIRGLGYSVLIHLEKIRGSILGEYPLLSPIDVIHVDLIGNAAGIQLNSFKVSDSSTVISAQGKLTGNILKPKSLLFDTGLKIHGQVDHALEIVESISSFKPFLPKSIHGEFNIDSKAHGDLTRILDTTQVDLKLTLKNTGFQRWKADLIEIDGFWNASPTGGQVQLLHGSIFSKEQARMPGIQEGSGGRIEIGAIKWKIGSSAPLLMPIHFHRAHLHWLGAPAIKDLYPLDLKLSGPVTLNIFPKEKKMEAILNTVVDEFSLDNQKYQQKNPLTTIFKIPKIGLIGQLKVNQNGIVLENVNLSLPQTKLKVKGKIDFKKGLDLYAQGPARLEDLGEIAEKKIGGQGNLNLYVHGPLSQVLVDIDIDFINAFYLNLVLGQVKGRIRWDDDPSFLVFSHVQGRQVGTKYEVDGKLSLGKANRADLSARILDGTIQDLALIFSNLIKDFHWFPKELTGSTRGTIDISGGLDMSQLKILSKLTGNNWQLYGERFKAIFLEGGYDRGSYILDDIRALKRTAEITGKFSFDANQVFDWNLESENFSVNDLNFISQLDVPIRGRIKWNSSGQGPAGKIESLTKLELIDLTVRGQNMSSSRFELKTHDGEAFANASIMEGQGTLEAIYHFNSSEKNEIRGELKQLDFTPILLMLNPQSIQDNSLNGYVSAKLDLKFSSGEFNKINGFISISDYLLSRAEQKFTLESPVYIKFENGNFDVNDAILTSESEAIHVHLKNKENTLNGSITGRIRNSIFEFFSPSIIQFTGFSQLNFKIRGKLEDPKIFGTVSLENVTLRLSSIDSPIEKITGTVDIQQNTFSTHALEANIGGGKIITDGKLVLTSEGYPSVSIKSVISKAKLKVFPFQYVQFGGIIVISGQGAPYSVDGKIQVNSALSREKVLNQKRGAGNFKALQYAPTAIKKGESGSSKVKLNIEVDAPRGIQIENELFREVQAKGNLTLINTLDAPRILGDAEIIQGKLIFKNHVFQIQNGSAKFDNPTVINPRVDMYATTDINGIKIQLFVTGPLDKFKIELSSTPSMQESEIFSLLALGLTPGDAKKLNSSDLNLVQQGEAASLVLHSLDFNRALEDKTGFQININEAIDRQQAVSAFRTQTQGDTSASPQITIRRKLGERLSLSAGNTLGTGTNRAMQFNLDYSVNRNFSLAGVFYNYGNYSTSEMQQATQTSFGVDFKFQQRFK